MARSNSNFPARAPRVLDRKQAVPALFPTHDDLLIVTGLAGAAKDMAALTGDADYLFTQAGAMGSASMIGFGLAMARPDRKVVVVTGDGELLMNIGCLATIAVHNPPNLSIVCVDNGHNGETGYQKAHTSLGADLEAMARAAGIASAMTVNTKADLATGRDLLHGPANGTRVVILRVKPSDPARFKRNMHGDECRVRFRAHVAKGMATGG